MTSKTLAQLDLYGASHTGNIRKTNEDQFLIASLSKLLTVDQSSIPMEMIDSSTNLHGRLLVVADGAANRPGGEWTAALAVQHFAAYVLQQMHWHLHEAETREDVVLTEFQDALRHCQKILTRLSSSDPDSQGGRATLTAAYLAWPNLFTVHSGNCRCYLFHDNCLTQVTSDDPFIDDPDDLKFSQRRMPFSRLRFGTPLRTIRNTPQLSFMQLESGDRVLLCSDGLTRYVSDERLLAVMMSQSRSHEICQQLIEEALKLGGADNITVIAATVPAEIPCGPAGRKAGIPIDIEQLQELNAHQENQTCDASEK